MKISAVSMTFLGAALLAGCHAPHPYHDGRVAYPPPPPPPRYAQPAYGAPVATPVIYGSHYGRPRPHRANGPHPVHRKPGHHATGQIKHGPPPKAQARPGKPPKVHVKPGKPPKPAKVGTKPTKPAKPAMRPGKPAGKPKRRH